MTPDAKKTASALVLELGKPSRGVPAEHEDEDEMDDEGLSDAAGESAAGDAMAAMKSGDAAGFYRAMKEMLGCMKD